MACALSYIPVPPVDPGGNGERVGTGKGNVGMPLGSGKSVGKPSGPTEGVGAGVGVGVGEGRGVGVGGVYVFAGFRG